MELFSEFFYGGRESVVVGVRVEPVSSVDSDEECAEEKNVSLIWCGWVGGPPVECMRVSGGPEDLEAGIAMTRPDIHRKPARTARGEAFWWAKE